MLKEIVIKINDILFNLNLEIILTQMVFKACNIPRTNSINFKEINNKCNTKKEETQFYVLNSLLIYNTNYIK